MCEQPNNTHNNTAAKLRLDPCKTALNSPTFKEQNGGGQIHPRVSSVLVKMLKKPSPSMSTASKLKYNNRVYRHFYDQDSCKSSRLNM